MHPRNVSAGGARVDIHECRRDGLWFDGGQLEKVVARPVYEVGLLQQATPPRRCPRCGHLHDHPAPVCELCGSLIGLTCVSCHARLSRLDVGGVDLQACPSCGGIWLERHGFEQLSGAAVAPSRDAICAKCLTTFPASVVYYSEAGPVCDACR
jgi:Zn-finger nucleic acid-binding protein